LQRTTLYELHRLQQEEEEEEEEELAEITSVGMITHEIVWEAVRETQILCTI
jgi:hypothetical protein